MPAKKTPKTPKSETVNELPPDAPTGRDHQARFSNLVASLQLTALYHLGEVPGPEGEKPTLKLTMARENVEMLEMLLEKTRGNLNSAESQLVNHALTSLRLHFVRKTE